MWIPIMLLALVLAAPALAVDGMLEISQTCAVNTGCVTGDAPGLPVRIGQAGSYRLTSDLAPTGSEDGILIASGVSITTIDLNGFRILGPNSGTGIGIRGEPNASAITIRNGTVAFMGDDGINIGGSAVIESVHALGNNGDGFDVNQTSIVRNSRIVGNTGFGINFSDRTSLYSGNVFSGNTEGSVNLGRPGGENLCDDFRCSRSSRRRFYLGADTYNGSEPDLPGACQPGFHFASLWEILDPTALYYDTDLGVGSADSGAGPPAISPGLPGFSPGVGWVRTGGESLGGSASGEANCNGWSLSDDSAFGTVVGLHRGWVTGAAPPINPVGPGVAPWVPRVVRCDLQQPLWCVED